MFFTMYFLMQWTKALDVKRERVLLVFKAEEATLLSPTPPSQAGFWNDFRASIGSVSISEILRLQRRINSNQSRRFQLRSLRKRKSYQLEKSNKSHPSLFFCNSPSHRVSILLKLPFFLINWWVYFVIKFIGITQLSAAVTMGDVKE